MSQKDDIQNQDGPPPDQADLDAATAADAAEALAAAQVAQKEITDLRTKLLRWQADFQNLQKRSAMEVLAAKQNADADFAKAMLQVLDHFDMALSVDPEKVDAKSLLNGVKITYDELRKILANRGIESYDPTGEAFNHDLHHAIMQEASDKPAGTVIQTFQQGYKMGDRVLRPAKVKVSK